MHMICMGCQGSPAAAGIQAKACAGKWDQKDEAIFAAKWKFNRKYGLYTNP